VVPELRGVEAVLLLEGQDCVRLVRGLDVRREEGGAAVALW
jgi:hypothetical protein